MVYKKRVFFDDVCEIVNDLGFSLKASTFKPDFIIAIAGGGLIPARLLRNHLNIPILTINLKLYRDVAIRNENVKMLQFLDQYSLRRIKNKKLLIVDEIHDSGKTARKAFELFLFHTKPENIGIAVLHHKNVKKESKVEEVFQNVFVGKEVGDEWIVYPWSEEDKDEISPPTTPTTPTTPTICDTIPDSKCILS